MGMMEQRGYWAMLVFLRGRQAAAPSEVLGRLLEELAVVAKGRPAEAVVVEWNEAVKDAFGYADEPFTGLHLS